MRKINFQPGQKVKTISGKECYVNCVEIYKDFIQYNIWDGEDKFQTMEEWQISPCEGTKSIGFTVK